MSAPRIAFVSREVHPFGGGGMGNYVTWSAEALTELGEVTILTTGAHRPAYDELRAAGDPRLPTGVRFEFIDEPRPRDVGSYYGLLHLWSARVLESLAALYPGGGPDLIEFPDYLGEGCVSLQARRTGDPRLARTLAAVRVNTTSELCWVLDGHVPSRLEDRVSLDLERYALRFADRVIWSGGDVLDTYERYYGIGAIAPAVKIPQVISPSTLRDPGPAPSPDGPLRLLYAGRLERRKGVKELLSALLGVEQGDWTLTLAGADTSTAPLGLSARRQLELAAAGDERIDFKGSVSRAELLDLISEHHVCVIPSIWECWPNVALEALMMNRPVLATPTGGLVEMAAPDAGWLTSGPGAAALATELERLIADRPAALAPIVAGGPRTAFDRLTDRGPIIDGYRELLTEAEESRLRTRGKDQTVLVSVVVPYFRLGEYAHEAIASLLAQTHRDLEVIVVNDGSFEEGEERNLVEIEALDPRVTVLHQPNSGLGAARNFGIGQSRGRFVLPFDADNVAEPTLVERLVEALEQAGPEIAYVTCWSRFIDEDGDPLPAPDGSYQPLGNFSRVLDTENAAGDATALFRREVFDSYSWSTDLHSVEDWLLYRQLRAAGLYGHAIPEPLVRYRVRRESMFRRVGIPNRERLLEEMEALLLESGVRWTAEPT